MTDGSKLNGISVVVYQKHENECRPVDCASRFLSSAENNYYPIEIEMLAVIWGIERMSMSVHGLPEFEVCTDHQPLVPILNNKPLVEMSPRFQSLRMKLLRYCFKAVHVPGKDLLDADAFSRAPVSYPTEAEKLAGQDIAVFVNGVIQQLPAIEKHLEEIKAATCEDKTMPQLIQTLNKGWPASKQDCPVDVQSWNFRGDITYLNDLLLKGDRIIIPSVMRREILSRIHEGHLGVEKCKKRAHQSVFWPGLNNQVEQVVGHCETCLKLLLSKLNDPLLPHKLLTRPWQKVGSDLFQFANDHYMVVVDYYSLWPEVYLLQKPNADGVIKAVKDAILGTELQNELI